MDIRNSCHHYECQGMHSDAGHLSDSGHIGPRGPGDGGVLLPLRPLQEAPPGPVHQACDAPPGSPHLRGPQEDLHEDLHVGLDVDLPEDAYVLHTFLTQYASMISSFFLEISVW